VTTHIKQRGSRKLCSQDFGETQPDEPLRVRVFRQSLIKALPRWPNNKDSLELAKRSSVGSLTIDYLNWASRFVPPRPRRVIVEPRVLLEPSWARNVVGVLSLLDRCRRGDTLSPHLSSMPWQRGFVPAAKKRKVTAEESWLDKDFVLTLSGWHHFHLGIRADRRGHVERTDDVLFAEVTRTTFTVTCILGHGVFTLNSPEMIALHQIKDARRAGRHPPGTVVLDTVIATSGHQLHIVSYASHCLRILAEIDPKLDDRAFLKELYEGVQRTPDRNPRLAWGFNGVDFGLFDLRQHLFLSFTGDGCSSGVSRRGRDRPLCCVNEERLLNTFLHHTRPGHDDVIAQASSPITLNPAVGLVFSRVAMMVCNPWLAFKPG
jgi:hypothetical protein